MDIYRITHRGTGKCYVGSTIRTTESRFREHCHNALRGTRGAPLYDAMRDDGVSAFDVETIATAQLYEELLVLEQQAIAAEGCVVPNGYNVVRGGRGNFGWKMRPETKAKIGSKAKGRPAHNKGIAHTDEAKARMLAGQLLQIQRRRERGESFVPWNKGVLATEGQRRKLAESHAGYRWTPAHRAACSGLKRSPATCELIAKNKRDWWAKRRSTTNLTETDRCDSLLDC